MSVDRVNTQTIGNGPGALATYLQALKDNDQFEQFNQGGSVIIGPKGKEGEGIRYNIESNSAGKDGLEAVQSVLSQIPKEITTTLSTEERVPLEHFANLQPQAAKAIFAIIKSSQNYNYSNQDSLVQYVQINQDGDYVSYDQDHNPIVVSQNLIVATGGRQKSLNLPSHISQKEEFSDDFLRKSFEEISAQYQGKLIAIIGGRHSAFSVADNLEQNKVASIIHHRSNPKLYFESEKEAQKFGYKYSSEDICPESGKINRFDGARGKARNIWLRSQANDSLALSRQYNGDLNQIRPSLEARDHIINATGYTPKGIDIYDAQGLLITQAHKLDKYEKFEGTQYPNANGRVFNAGLGETSRDGTGIFVQQAQNLITNLLQNK